MKTATYFKCPECNGFTFGSKLVDLVLIRTCACGFSWCEKDDHLYFVKRKKSEIDALRNKVYKLPK